MAGSGPRYTLCGELGIPAAGAGTGYADSKGHAPNENMPIERYLQGIKFAATIFQEFADKR